MDTYTAFYSRLLMPAWEGLVRDRPTMTRWALLDQTQWRPSEEIQKLRLAHLRRLLLHAGERIPHYRDLFRRERFDPAGLRTLDELAQLPILTREVVRERYRDLVDPATADTRVSKHTSGSTGEPVFFEYDRGSEVWRQAVKWRSYAWAGYVPGVRAVHYWGAPVPLRGLRGMKVRCDRFLRRERYVDCLQQHSGALRKTVAVIRRHRPEVLVGYTLATATLARYVLEHKLADWPPINVLVGAEALVEEDRHTIGAAFGGRVFETYGSRETMLIAAECDAHTGLHTMDEAHIVEILVGGRPARPGETGEVVVTDLHNYGMPFVRYRNGDLATAGKGSCPCGRGLGRIERVAGRRIDTLRAANGSPVPGMMICAVVASLRHQIREYQVVQRPNGHVILRIVRGSGFDSNAMEPILATIRRYLRGQPVTASFVEHIDRNRSGKQRPVVVEDAAGYDTLPVEDLRAPDGPLAAELS
jgi:phenylacetate-CoA ligase